MARISPFVLIPPLAFAAVAGLFLGGMYFGNGRELPSTLIGQTAPAVPQEALAGQPMLTDADLRSGELTLVNFWASWCPPCRLEHETLLDLAAQGYRVAGVNIRDDAEKATAYLDENGTPFFASGFDPKGRTSIDWGVTAPPETFIVDGNGVVLFRFAGPLVDADFETRFLPALKEAEEN